MFPRDFIREMRRVRVEDVLSSDQTDAEQPPLAPMEVHDSEVEFYEQEAWVIPPPESSVGLSSDVEVEPMASQQRSESSGVLDTKMFEDITGSFTFSYLGHNPKHMLGKLHMTTLTDTRVSKYLKKREVKAEEKLPIAAEEINRGWAEYVQEEKAKVRRMNGLREDHVLNFSPWAVGQKRTRMQALGDAIKKGYVGKDGEMVLDIEDFDSQKE